MARPVTSFYCSHPGCKELRWRGPKGDNNRLYLCETHQRESWRKNKNKQLGRDPSQPKLKKDGTPRKSRSAPAPEPAVVAHQPKMIKVVVVNRTLDLAQLVEVPVISEMPFSEIRRPDALLKLLRGSGHVVVYADRDKV